MKKLASLALAAVMALTVGLTTHSAFAGGAVDYDEASCTHYYRTAYIAEHDNYVGLRVWKDHVGEGTPLVESYIDMSGSGIPSAYGTFSGDYYTVSANFPEQPNGTQIAVEIYSTDEPDYGHRNGYFTTTSTYECNSVFNPTPTPSPSATPDPSTAPEPTVQPVSSNHGGSNFSEPSKPAAPHCSNPLPTSVTQLFQVDAQSNQATLYFTPGGDNTSSYHIAYGFSATDERFGVQFDASQKDGVQAYQINHLAPGTTYYFKVRPANGCAGGAWSNVLKVTTTKSASAKKSFYLFNGKKE